MQHRWVTAQQLTALLGSAPIDSPAYRGLADRIRLLIVDGRLSHELRLPSERDLAEALGLSRTTVAGGYAELRERGFLQARRGAGNFVTIPFTRVRSTHLPGPFTTDSGDIGLVCATTTAPCGVAEAYRHAMEKLPSLLAGIGYLPDGLEELREALADRYTLRGLPTTADQLIITAGATSALNIVGRTLLGAGDRLLLETPTYSNSIEAARQLGARPIGFPITSEGWDLSVLKATLRQTTPRAAYLIPDFHNPTGALMPDGQRLAVAHALKRHQTIPIIDETLADFPLDGQEMPAPFACSASEAVTIGSASKTFWGGLRIGWIRAPRPLVRPLIETRAAMDLGAVPFEQLVLTELLKSAEPIMVVQRRAIRERRDHLIQLLAEHLPSWEHSAPTGGLSLWVTLPKEASTRIAAVAEGHGVVVTPGPRFFVENGGERNLRIPYTAEIEVLTKAVTRLAAVWQEVQERPVHNPVSSRLGLSA